MFKYVLGLGTAQFPIQGPQPISKSLGRNMLFSFAFSLLPFSPLNPLFLFAEIYFGSCESI
jgi:hypothetical protein